MEQVRRASWFNDEPLAHVNHGHLLLISEYAKPWVTVLLSGEGADEVMGGYVRYRPLYFPTLLNLARPVFPPVARALGLGRRWDKLSRFLALGSIDRAVLMNSCDTLPDDLEAIGMTPSRRYPFREEILAEAHALFPGEPVRQVMYSDQHAFLCSLLDRNDRMTMGASIECRVPFLDYRLVEGLAGLSSQALLSFRESKHLLRKSLGSRLPKAILEHRKWGFGVPWSRYLRERPDFMEVLHELPNLKPVCDGPFDRARLKAVLQSFLSGDDRQQALVLQLVLIAIWHDVCVRTGVAPTGNGSAALGHSNAPGKSA
jgi:asparagine synthase (glutamine-hydrolysing)